MPGVKSLRLGSLSERLGGVEKGAQAMLDLWLPMLAGW